MAHTNNAPGEAAWSSGCSTGDHQIRRGNRPVAWGFFQIINLNSILYACLSLPSVLFIFYRFSFRKCEIMSQNCF